MSHFFEVTPDRSIVRPNGDVMLFSVERFEGDICRGGCCFICGAAPGSKAFNDEHILPRWLLRRHNLFDSEITLPNGTAFRYDRYKIPCCQECNTFMGKVIEEPVRELVAAGYEAVAKHLLDHGPDLFFRWLSLIYIKTHLRDATFPWTRDRRQDLGAIAEVYDWATLHHIHCVARSIRFGIGLGHGVIGSFAALPALDDGADSFDYGDMYFARSILIRSGQTAFLAVLDDSCAAHNAYSAKFKKITAPLSSPQLREILSHLGFCNVHLKHRPKFGTTPVDDGFEIVADIPATLEFDWSAPPSLGEVMWFACSPFLAAWPEPEREVIAAGLRDGRWSWMFDRDGQFIDNAAFGKPWTR